MKRPTPGSFYERFREEVTRYADGVHELGAPLAPSALAAVPPALRDFYASWDGARLFVDAWVIYPADELTPGDEGLVFGETGVGDALVLDDAGHVVRIEDDSGERLVEGTSFARWIEATVAAEQVFYDHEGEFQDEVFDEHGDEPRPDAIAKREQKYLRLDPGAPAPTWRLAQAQARLGRTREALRLLGDAIAADPAFAWARFDLGRLLFSLGDHEAAERAFATAADTGGEHAPHFAAQAARAAAARGAEPARAAYAAKTLALAPDLVASQRRAAAAQLEDEAFDDARELIELGLAVSPRDLELLDLRRRLPPPAPPKPPRTPKPEPPKRPPAATSKPSARSRPAGRAQPARNAQPAAKAQPAGRSRPTSKPAPSSKSRRH